jgi:hypothetical protein
MSKKSHSIAKPVIRDTNKRSRILRWFQEHRGKVTEQHRSHLYARGFSDERISQYGIFSLSPYWNNSGKLEGCPIFELVSGNYLESVFAESSIVTPVMGSFGIVGFNFRTIEGFKYVNGGLQPGSKKIFDYRLEAPAKNSEALVGLSECTIRKCLSNKTLWITEGFFDAVVLEMITEDPVLSLQTAAPSQDTLMLLYKLSRSQINIVFDNDRSGLEGAEKIKAWFAKKGLHRVNNIRYAGKDPGDIWLRSGKPGLVKQFKSWTI